MMNIQRYLLVMSMVGLLMNPVWVFAETHGSEPSVKPVAQLYVRGEAQLKVPPDQVSVSLGVTTEATTVKKALAANTKKMNGIINGLRILGLADHEFQTQRFRTQPIWSRRPNNAGSNWRAKIIAYRVSNSLLVTTQRLEEISDIIDVSTTAGANEVGNIQFSLFNPRVYRERAITQAMQNAKADALTLTSASGDTIKRTLSLTLDNAVSSVARVERGRAKMSMLESVSADAAAPPINSGDITVRASVSVTYELAEQE